METVLRIIAVLSFLAFVVGIFKPATVMCKSRGKVALIYLGVFIICVFIGASIMENNSTLKEANEEQKVSEKAEGKPAEIPVLSIGSVYTMRYSNADVKISFDNIQVKRIPNDGLNLIFSLTIKNNSNETFFISNCDWKLLDSDKVEVEEAGIYDQMFGDFMPSTFFFTTVEPNIGKREKVGYSVKEETYYLSIDGKVIAQIPLDKKE
ncbi:MAG: DUF4352 domain-containing protein [Bacteroidales bacterium]|nr:DUF4352 domain-containing protein [Bacteroidales bacterium]